MRQLLALGIICLGTVGCGKPEKQVLSDLPVYARYPETINAIAATGQLVRNGNCLTFVRSDGMRLVPIFREGTLISSLEKQFGNLTEPRNVTISGYNVIDPIPAGITKSLADHNCVGTPIFYGSLLPGQITPAIPQS